jgi:hypothetical protein
MAHRIRADRRRHFHCHHYGREGPRFEAQLDVFPDLDAVELGRPSGRPLNQRECRLMALHVTPLRRTIMSPLEYQRTLIGAGTECIGPE